MAKNNDRKSYTSHEQMRKELLEEMRAEFKISIAEELAELTRRNRVEIMEQERRLDLTLQRGVPDEIRDMRREIATRILNGEQRQFDVVALAILTLAECLG